MFKTRKFGISWLDIAVAVARWKVNFSSATNWGEDFILPIVPFRFDQSKSNRTPLAYRFASSTVPPNPFRMLGLFKDKIIIFTEVLINVNFGYIPEYFFMADNVPNDNAWFPTSLFTIFGNLFLILLWSTMWFIDFIYRKPQLSIRGFFHRRGKNFCDRYFLSFLNIFIFFKKSSQGRMQGAAIATNAAPQNSSC